MIHIPCKDMFRIIAAVYILALIILAFLGFSDDPNIDTLDHALKYFSKLDVDIARSYFLYGLIPTNTYRIIVIIFLLFLSVKGYYLHFAELLARRFKSRPLQIAVSLTVLFSLLMVLRFPFALFTGFIRKEMFGLMKIDIYTWIFRYLSAGVISILLSVIAITILSVIIYRTKRYYFYIPIVFLILSLTFTIIYPRFITPLFYDTVKLPDNDLKIKIFKLLRKTGVEIDDIYIINKSRYSVSANAYMTGFGPDKKIYIYDSLLHNFNDNEVLSIIAHEVSHFVKEDMLIGLLLASGGIFLILPMLNFISIYFLGRNLKSLVQPENHPALLMLLIITIFISKPIENSISRRIEHRADLYSINLTEDPDTFIEMKKRMAIINRSHLLPHPVYVWFYYTHPRILDRIKIAEEFKELQN